MTTQASVMIPTGAPATRWAGEAGHTGTVAVVGLGKIGLPLAAQYAARGWHVIGVDVSDAVVAGVRAGRSHVVEEPGLAELVATAHAAGRLEATTSHAVAAARADVVVMIVPVMLTPDHQPDHRAMDAASTAVAAGLRPDTLVVYETTLPVGDTRGRYVPLLERASGLGVGNGAAGIHVAFSPERVFSGRILEDLAAYPKLVGGVDEDSLERAARFYASALPAHVRRLPDTETAEFAKLAETTYRDVNIALATEFAAYADRVGVDILEVIDAANSQPYSNVHQPGIGVGGHCIPVYPHFLLARAPELSLVRAARRVNDAGTEVAIDAVRRVVGDLRGVPVLILGVTYRSGVHELACSRASVLARSLRERGAEVWGHDPLMDEDELQGLGMRPYRWGEPSSARAIVTQTADPRWGSLDAAWFPDLEVLYDGRNSLRGLALPADVTYLGVGSGGRRSGPKAGA